MPAWLTLTALRNLPWRYIALALAAFAILFGAYRWARGTGYHARDNEVAQITARAIEAEGSVTRLKAAVTEQNAAVVAIEREADKRAAAGAAAMEQVEAVNKRQAGTIQSLRNSAKLTYAKDAPCEVSGDLAIAKGL